MSVRPRDTAASNRTMVDGGLVNDKIKNKFTKLQGNFAKTSKPTPLQQAPQVEILYRFVCNYLLEF